MNIKFRYLVIVFILAFIYVVYLLDYQIIRSETNKLYNSINIDAVNREDLESKYDEIEYRFNKLEKSIDTAFDYIIKFMNDEDSIFYFDYDSALKEAKDEMSRILEILSNSYRTKTEKIMLDNSDFILLSNNYYHVYTLDSDNTRNKTYLYSYSTDIYRDDIEQSYIIIKYDIYKNDETGEYIEFKDNSNKYPIELHIGKNVTINEYER